MNTSLIKYRPSATTRLTIEIAITRSGAHTIRFIKPYKAAMYTTATTNKIIVPAMSALSAPAATPMYPVFSDSARESGLAHQKPTLPMSPTMLMNEENEEFMD